MRDKYLGVFLICAFITWIQSPVRLSRTPDSLFYTVAAEHHLRGEDMRNLIHNGRYSEVMYPSNGYFVSWGPLYPWTLARLMGLGFSPNDSGRIINALGMGSAGASLLYFLKDYKAWKQGGVFLAFLMIPSLLLAKQYLMSEVMSLGLLLPCLALLDWLSVQDASQG